MAHGNGRREASIGAVASDVREFAPFARFGTWRLLEVGAFGSWRFRQLALSAVGAV
jgi:hypothetical protein